MTECCSLPRRGSKPIKQNKRRNHVEWFRLFCTFYRVTPGGDCLYPVLVARHTVLLYHALIVYEESLFFDFRHRMEK